MLGPQILVRSLSVPHTTDKSGNAWQYHSRSDRHSKIACWVILFDLIENCALFREHVVRGEVGFGINHTMSDFKTGKKKKLDLVVCTRGSGKTKAQTFAELPDSYGIVLTDDERATLGKQPRLERYTVGSVHVALEAKATMTAHSRALPRLWDELNSSYIAIHGASDLAIAAAFAMVNIAPVFISSDENKFDLSEHSPVVSRHVQPRDAVKTVEKLKQVPRRSRTGENGFDAMGIVVVDCRNDGSPVLLHKAPPAPDSEDSLHYDSMIHRIKQWYENRFSNL